MRDSVDDAVALAASASAAASPLVNALEHVVEKTKANVIGLALPVLVFARCCPALTYGNNLAHIEHLNSAGTIIPGRSSMARSVPPTVAAFGWFGTHSLT